MKNLFKFVFVMAIFAGSFMFAQSKEDLEAFDVVKSEKVLLSNNIVNSFFESTRFKSNNPDVIINEENVELLTLKNNYQVVKLTIDKNENFNLIYAVYDPSDRTFNWYFMANNEKEIKVMSPEKELIISYVQHDGFVSIGSVAGKRSPFGKCMDAVEEDFTNDWIGWAAWNSSPLPAIVAATMCQICVTKHKSCPPAYHP
ncbi:hypothetical protein [Chryseobacterium sp. HMWF035]|uniref:hypothetical protein n=1 Tax=Chryseobacterium sp. HMWF035 TaxID=2056868 RepID=UPI000D585653|nr:hypothetical protein [Chryseobacterium sp. HMWF035]PVV49960.1 hypothetical protein DD829_22690 [Chryseobacterium sp. HMWF035]